MTRRGLTAAAWVGAYLVLIAFPLLALLAGPTPTGLAFWWDLAMAFGFAGLAVMGLQFGLTARFRRASAPFGIDIIYYFHRLMALVGVALLLAHWWVLRWKYAPALMPWTPGDAPGYMTAGRVALGAFAVVVATSLWRKQLRIEYDFWRVLHIVVAVAAVVLALWHVTVAGYYTGDGWRRGLLVGYTLAWVGLVAYIRAFRPWRLTRRPYRVTGVRPERGRAWTLTVAPDGHEGLRFSPGQFAWLSLRASPFQAREHPFSFSGSAEAAPEKLEFTIRELGDFTSTIGQTQVGETAYVDAPHGVFTTDRHPDATGYVFVAGGVGVAPMMSMIRTLADRGDPRPLHLVYANDRWDDVLFREELEALAGRMMLRVTHVLLEPPRGGRERRAS
jgi:predicted ferric reductase